MVFSACYLFTLVWRLPPFPSCHPILPEVPNSGHLPRPCQWHANSNGSGEPIVKPVWYPMEQAGYFHGAKRAKPRHSEWSTNSKGEHHESSTNWNATDNTRRIIKPHIGQFSATSCAQLRHKPEVITCGNILCTTFFFRRKEVNLMPWVDSDTHDQRLRQMPNPHGFIWDEVHGVGGPPGWNANL